MLTQNSGLTNAQLREKLNDPETNYLIIQNREGMVFVNKADSSVIIVPNDGPPKILTQGLCN